MKRYNRLFSLLLALALAWAIAAPAGAGDLPPSGSAPLRAVVVYSPQADPDQMAQALARLPGVTLLWRYDRLLSGAAVEAPASALAALEDVAGVARVGLAHAYSRPQAIYDPLQSSNSLPLMAAEALDFNGDGMVIAVLDSGLRTSHEAFTDYGLAQSPALSPEDVAAFIAGGGTAGKYISPRIPFAYDYVGRDDDVSTTDDHGTHVSAIALGCAKDAGGGIKFRGVAPAAQLLSMKVFPDGASAQADDAVILRAMEDAYALGADVINLSLGSDNGFTQDDTLHGVYRDIFQRLWAEGVVVCAAAGNAGSSVMEKDFGLPLPTAGYVDYGSAASPGTYPGALSVGAVDAMTYQTAGFIAAGEQQLAYTDGSSEAGEDPPPLASLAGEALGYVAVPGLGEAADYAGLDLTGRIALVRRGTVTFTEKAQNAAAAGALACLIYNNEPGEIVPAVEGLAIPCAAVTQEAGEALLELAGASGQGVLTVSAGSFLRTLHDQPTPFSYSAWGATSDLRLVPAISAPGGAILSASAEDDGAYEQLSGTSMAAPNASGAFAVLLQALRAAQAAGQAEPPSAAETAALARDLLESTARVLAGEDGVCVSPRKQGAGLIDLSAALQSELVITDPLLELGESSAGRFTAAFQVQNRSGSDMTLSVEPTVLTDAYTTDGGSCYSLLSAMDITDRVSLGGDSAVTVPAGGTKTVTVTISVPLAVREELGQVFPNGFFTEGYITLTGEAGQAVHATFLGFCGDWQAAPILEPVDFRDVIDARTLLAHTIDAETGKSLLDLGQSYQDVLPINLGANLAYLSGGSRSVEQVSLLGDNPWAHITHSDSRSAIPAQDTDALYTDGSFLVADAYALRNAAHLIMVVSDAATGKLLYADDVRWLTKAGQDPYTLELAPSGWFCWDGTDSLGQPLPDGTRVSVAFYGWLDSDAAMASAYARHAPSREDPSSYRWLTGGSYDRCLEWSFPLTIDGEAPTVAVRPDGAQDGTLAVTVRDNQFLAYASIRDGEGALLAEEAFSDEKAGTSHTLTVDLSGYEVPPAALYVTAADYASNTTGYSIDVSALAAGEAAEPSLCAMALLTDVDQNAWYHEAVDYVYAAGLMSGSEKLTFQPAGSTTRAQVITILYRLAGEGGMLPLEAEAAPALPFTDVQAGAWYRQALEWAYGNGLVEGYNETTFGAFASISRQQLAVMLCRFCAAGGMETAATEDYLAAFPDAGQISEYAVSAMNWAVGRGLLSGRADGSLDPRGGATRAEVAQILMRFLEK